MFSFNKKPHSSSELYNHFSEDEKSVILCLLYAAMNCDNSGMYPQEVELKYLNNFVHIFNTSAKKVTQYYSSVGPERIFIKFQRMPRSKVEEILFLIMGMLTSDGSLNETEVRLLSTLLEQTNITAEEFIEKVKLTEALANKFLK